MDKALRNAIIAGIIIIAISFGYYLVVFLPKKEAMRIEQQKQKENLLADCLKKADEQYQKDMDGCNDNFSATRSKEFCGSGGLADIKYREVRDKAKKDCLDLTK